jgi:hypothetical protein
MSPRPEVKISFPRTMGMEILFALSVAAALLWLAFGDKKDWKGL